MDCNGAGQSIFGQLEPLTGEREFRHVASGLGASWIRLQGGAQFDQTADLVAGGEEGDAFVVESNGSVRSRILDICVCARNRR